MQQAMNIFAFTGTDIIQTRLLSLYSGKKQDHGVMNIFLTLVMSPQHPEH
jgi:hypothetical protein